MKKYCTLIFLIIACNYTHSYAQIARYVYTFAGAATGGGGTGDGGPATAATFWSMTGVCGNSLGDIYIGDHLPGNIRKVDRTTGVITLFAGGRSGNTGNGGPATAAGMKPWAIYCNAKGDVFMADEYNSVVRRIDAASDYIYLVYLDSTYGNEPYGIAQDKYGNTFITFGNSVTSSCLITKVDTSGHPTIIAGNPSSTSTYSGDGVPAIGSSINASGIAFDNAGNLFFSDVANNLIREINSSNGRIYTIAGNRTLGSGFSGDGGPATNAQLNNPQSIAVDMYGNVIIGDCGNNRIRMVDAATGRISTVAGGGSLITEGAPATNSSISVGYIYLDQRGNLFVAGGQVKKITNFAPSANVSGSIISDSFVVSINQLCNGPQLFAYTDNYTPGYSIISDYGDGNIDTIAVTSARALINHTYGMSGSYSIKQVLFNGLSRIDSNNFTYEYAFCRTLPIAFYLDDNANCVKDISESYELNPTRTEVDSNGIAIDTLSATSGFSYNAYSSPGTIYSFKVIDAAHGLETSCPASGYLNDTVTSSVVVYPTKLFGLSCTGTPFFDLAVNSVIPVTGMHDQWGNIYVRNYSCLPTDAAITLTFSPKCIVGFTSPSASSYTSNSITWDASALSSNSSGPVNLYYEIVNNPSTGYLTAGDTVQEHIKVTPFAGDHDTSNNINIVIDTVKASCDPNELFVTPPGCLQPSTSTQLQYTIHFENTGTDTAFNIYIMDTLSDYLDPHSLRIINASAVMNIDMQKCNSHNIVRFDFPNVNLLDSSHHNACDGSVIFTINTRSNLSQGLHILNHAGIFFDYNSAVPTNITDNIIGCPNPEIVPILEESKTLLYPNPATEELTIKTAKDAYQTFCITNTFGQLLRQNKLNATETKIDVNTLAAGVYYIILRGEMGSKTEKFVKL